MSAKLQRLVSKLPSHLFDVALEKMLLLELARHAKDDGSGIHLSVPRVVSLTGISISTVSRRMASLQNKGYIKVVRKYSAIDNTPYKREICIEKIKDDIRDQAAAYKIVLSNAKRCT